MPGTDLVDHPMESCPDRSPAALHTRSPRISLYHSQSYRDMSARMDVAMFLFSWDSPSPTHTEPRIHFLSRTWKLTLARRILSACPSWDSKCSFPRSLEVEKISEKRFTARLSGKWQKYWKKISSKLVSNNWLQLPATFSTISYGKSFVESLEKNDHIVKQTNKVQTV